MSSITKSPRAIADEARATDIDALNAWRLALEVTRTLDSVGSHRGKVVEAAADIAAGFGRGDVAKVLPYLYRHARKGPVLP